MLGVRPVSNLPFIKAVKLNTTYYDTEALMNAVIMKCILKGIQPFFELQKLVLKLET